MWTSLLQALATTESGSPKFLALIFLVNVLGEVGIPFPLVMPGLLVFIGYGFAHGDTLASAALLVCALVGSGSGAALMYWLSRWLGMGWVQRSQRFLPGKGAWLAKAQARLGTARPISIALGRAVPGMMVPMSLASGVLRVRWLNFMAGVGISELIWVGLFIGLGMGLGFSSRNLEPLFRYFPSGIGIAAGGIVLFTLGRWAWRRLGSKGDKPLLQGLGHGNQGKE